ncbi:MAG TPA: BrnT family toxin [Pyrinomonadaceae bacterium]|jgi:uncharacterized DUF497 family protein
MSYQFEWNDDKAKANRIKHGVSFDEASTVFDDPLARIFDDAVHSLNERREIIIGQSMNERLLLVSFTARPGEIIRIISARALTKKERKDYEEAVKRRRAQR